VLARVAAAELMLRQLGGLKRGTLAAPSWSDDRQLLAVMRLFLHNPIVLNLIEDGDAAIWRAFHADVFTTLLT
jgi:hypothetical protein